MLFVRQNFAAFFDERQCQREPRARRTDVQRFRFRRGWSSIEPRMEEMQAELSMSVRRGIALRFNSVVCGLRFDSRCFLFFDDQCDATTGSSWQADCEMGKASDRPRSPGTARRVADSLWGGWRRARVEAADVSNVGCSGYGSGGLDVLGDLRRPCSASYTR